jgi:serine/threonine protein kinase
VQVKCIAHLDLKPDNILLVDHVAKISDLGSSRLCTDKQQQLKDCVDDVGTLVFMDPSPGSKIEFPQARFNFTSDIYSFGIIMWCIIFFQLQPYPEPLRPGNNKESQELFKRRVRAFPWTCCACSQENDEKPMATRTCSDCKQNEKPRADCTDCKPSKCATPSCRKPRPPVCIFVCLCVSAMLLMSLSHQALRPQLQSKENFQSELLLLFNDSNSFLIDATASYFKCWTKSVLRVSIYANDRMFV